MLETIKVSTLIGVIGCIVGVVGAFQSWKVHSRKEIKDTSNDMITLRSDIKYITKSLDRLEDGVKNISQKIEDTSGKLIELESNQKTIFKYIDEFRERIEKLEGKN